MQVLRPWLSLDAPWYCVIGRRLALVRARPRVGAGACENDSVKGERLLSPPHFIPHSHPLLTLHCPIICHHRSSTAHCRVKKKKIKLLLLEKMLLLIILINND